MKIVFYGLTITSSWGNGHATTYRSLCKALARRGHTLTFVEKDVEWYRSNRDRQPKLLALLNDTARRLMDESFIVAGPQYPDTEPWADNVERIIHLSPPQHPAFYSSSRFTLNLTRNDMVAAGWSPSVRLFEASACGAALLSDPWPGLEDFLTPGSEILLPKTAYDVADILRHTPDAARHTLGQRARDRILAQHTSAHRAEQFEQVLQHCR